MVSIEDQFYSTISNGKSWYAPTVTYTSGQRTTATDQTGKSTGAFTDPTCLYGVHFVPTLIEAVAAMWACMGYPGTMDLAPLGL